MSSSFVQLGDLTYQEMISLVEIEDINIRRLNMESFISPQDVHKYLIGNKTIEADIKHEFKLDRKEGDIYALGLIQASVKIDDLVVYTVDVEIRIKYDFTSIKKNIPEKYFHYFVEHNVPIHIWPYVREIIQTGSTRMGYPPLVIRPYRKFLIITDNRLTPKE